MRLKVERRSNPSIPLVELVASPPFTIKLNAVKHRNNFGRPIVAHKMMATMCRDDGHPLPSSHIGHSPTP